MAERKVETLVLEEVDDTEDAPYYMQQFDATAWLAKPHAGNKNRHSVYIIYGTYSTFRLGFTGFTVVRGKVNNKKPFFIFEEEVFHTQVYAAGIDHFYGFLNSLMQVFTTCVDINKPLELGAAFGGVVNHKKIPSPKLNIAHYH